MWGKFVCQRKIMQKKLKIFFKKNVFFLNLFLGYEKRGFWPEGGKIPRKKCLDHKKKRQSGRLKQKQIVTIESSVIVIIFISGNWIPQGCDYELDDGSTSYLYCMPKIECEVNEIVSGLDLIFNEDGDCGSNCRIKRILYIYIFSFCNIQLTFGF